MPSGNNPKSIVIPVAVGIALAALGLYGFYEYDRRARAAEELRLADEAMEAKRIAEVEARRKREAELFQAELAARKEADERIRQMDADFRREEVKRAQFVEGELPKKPDFSIYIDQADRRRAEWERQREEAESNRQSRQQDYQQREYVRQREAEEEMARYRRDQSARESQARAEAQARAETQAAQAPTPSQGSSVTLPPPRRPTKTR
jgi:hypothetical protein